MKTRLLEDLPQKISAIILALLLWVHVATDKTYELTAAIPVTSVIIPDEFCLAEAPPDSIFVIVSSTAKRFWRSGWRKAGLVLRADGARRGRREYDVDLGNLSLVSADGITLYGVATPRTIRLNLDIREERVVPVVSRMIVETAPGFAVSVIDSFFPQRVTATGPRSSIQRLNAAFTESRELNNVSSAYDLKVGLEAVGLYGVVFEPSEITYRILVQAVRERLFSGAPVVIFNAPHDSISVSPASVDLTLIGPLEMIDTIQVSDITVSADFRASDSAGFARIKVSLPSRLSIKKISDTLVYFSVDSSGK
ncbi:MAG: YbbR-like domain-containing protein [candidate division Zixibacteria bacterium]|nr:YbbR-like domain-containing protein [candidate division Zixibacteria bacterium]